MSERARAFATRLVLTESLAVHGVPVGLVTWYWSQVSIPMWILYSVWLLSVIFNCIFAGCCRSVTLITLVMAPIVSGLLFTTQVPLPHPHPTTSCWILWRVDEDVDGKGRADVGCCRSVSIGAGGHRSFWCRYMTGCTTCICQPPKPLSPSGS